MAGGRGYMPQSELPPRARRIQDVAHDADAAKGTTSACAENTERDPVVAAGHRNYLRVRGEYRPIVHNRRPHKGTTSACAENTGGEGRHRCRLWNYLRVRGEYNCPPCNPCNIAELPPRARRIPSRAPWQVPLCGTTSACAENTHAIPLPTIQPGNYLRVRGEYLVALPKLFPKRELPPRARRIHGKSLSVRMGLGTTSACAENTLSCRPTLRSRWNYLRVRGEYSTACGAIRILWELPPRARRIPPPMHYLRRYLGTTSACAENTAMRPARSHRHGNYLRVRGEYWGI